ncbi:MAG TPA: hypothetical protein PKM44_00720 [Turneriella sp.]|nr:hypothetical protein [Turneriella sp.]HMY11035.1 hypothetical protein [Turneriella sp.]HNA79256.1 hypothetical protein [Turneriella sp.]HNE18990.1 hypothetical protein [Turneriella sp.]HNJ66856.1 hypothetical protein [Turneriella sp.]
MTYFPQLLSAFHWLGVALYCGALFFFIIIFQRVYERYRAYRYVDNFRGEVVLQLWRLLHVCFVVIVLSGAALAGLKGKSVLTGLYGLVFSSKLALWLLQLWLLQDLLKPFLTENYTEEPQARSREWEARSLGAVLLLFLIAAGGFLLKYLP